MFVDPVTDGGLTVTTQSSLAPFADASTPNAEIVAHATELVPLIREHAGHPTHTEPPAVKGHSRKVRLPSGAEVGSDLGTGTGTGTGT